MDDGTVPIPQPPGLPFLGNITNINPQAPLESFIHLADVYGPIYRLSLAGKAITIVSSHALVNEACDESRFGKKVDNVLNEIRHGVHDGLFTADTDEPNWGLAHRILVPAFGPMSIKSMFDEMSDISGQMVLKWARQGPSKPIMVTDDFTRLTLDVLALCSMGYRFNSFYHDELHPFIQAMGDFLTESGRRSRRPPVPSFFYRKADRKYAEDIEVLRQTADGVLQARKENPSGRKDLMAAMLDGVDAKTGQKLGDSSIIDNLITFLIAGHETTSGLLSFAFYQLLKNPEAYRKAQHEVDQVVGKGSIQVEHMSKLPYVAAVLRETLRLSATIPIFGVTALKDQVMGGKYKISKGDNIALLLSRSHLDPAVYGDTANEFVPERMLDDNFERLQKEFPNCWKPFGNGMRGCIGRPFAWQEAVLVMAMLLQNFDFTMDDPSYQLDIKETLTIKPKDFYMRAALRDGITATQLEQRLAGSSAPAKPASHVVAGAASKKRQQPAGKPMSIYYGSNSGTCESLAQRLAADAAAHGFSARVVDPLDAAYQKLPTDQPVVVVTASYEGEPPDNAARFVSWLKSLGGRELDGVSYAVFGCGHHDWAQTFHRIPKLVDSKMEELGASRVAAVGLTDCARGDMFTDFETWEDEVLWPALAARYGVAEAAEGADAFPPGFSVEVSTPRSSTLRQDVRRALVVETRLLTAGGAPPKKHMEIELPTDARYAAGDYLAVLPVNPDESVQRAMRRFRLPWDAHLTISADGRTHLPAGTSVPARDVLGAYVELAQPATRRGVLALAEAARDEPTRAALARLAADDYASAVSARRASVLDLLDAYPAVALPLGTFLSLLPPMRVRQYSISSSPLRNRARATLTYSLLSAPSLAAPDQTHAGVASSYLAALAPGDALHVAVRPSHAAFHLPADPERTPLVCIAAGSGIAPFRAFVQERAAMMGAGRQLAPALLFLGCRAPGVDDLYRDELDGWEAAGAVAVRRAYSRSPDSRESRGCRYVQDRLWADRDEAKALWARGAKVFVCGSREVGEGVKAVVLRIRREMAEADGGDASQEASLKWFESIRNERYATDVFD